MKKANIKKLDFKSLSVIELNNKQLNKIKGGSQGQDIPVDDQTPYTPTIICTQTGPNDKYSQNCIIDI